MFKSKESGSVERENIASVVRKHLIEVAGGLKESDIDMSRSMKDFGANSLDIVEVVSLTMRELRVKVPRSELSKLTNMDGLVDLLYASLQEKLKAASTT
jgi:acyl carrier protein